MEKSLIKKAADFLLEHRRRKRRYKVVTGLAMIVVFITVYLLILPAVTAERKTICGLEEHTHTEECFDTAGNTVCGLEEHVHTDSCFKKIANKKIVYNSPAQSDNPETDSYYHDEDTERRASYNLSVYDKKDSDKAEDVSDVKDSEDIETINDENLYPEDEIISGEYIVDDEPQYGPQENDQDTADSEESPDDFNTVPDDVASGGSVDGSVTETHSEDYVEAYTETTTEYVFDENAEDKFICGLEEHTHDSSCYDEYGNLICDRAEHVHDKYCLASTPSPISFTQVFPGSAVTLVMDLNYDLSYTLTITGTGSEVKLPESYVLWGLDSKLTQYKSRISEIIVTAPEDSTVVINSESFKNCLGLKKFEFTNPVKLVLGAASFSGCINLEYFDFENSTIIDFGSMYATNVEDFAKGGMFYNTALREVNFTTNPKIISPAAFFGCKDLKKVHFGEGPVNSIGAGVFQNCESLEDINLGDLDGTKFSGYQNNNYNDYAQHPEKIVGLFKGCTSLKTIEMPSGNYTFLSDGSGAMFCDCTALESVDMGTSTNITELGKICMFLNTPSLKEIDLSGLTKLETISDRAFQSSGITKVVLPASLKNITSNAFQDCVNLETIELPEDSQLETISAAFANCQSLKAIDFSALTNLKTITSNAFANCISLRTVILPASLTKLDGSSFKNTEALSEFYVGSTSLDTASTNLFLNSYSGFTLTIGKNCDTINGNLLSAAAGAMDKLVFERPNEFEITGDANTGFQEPLNTFSGRYYVTEQGDIYKLTDENGEKNAVLVCVGEERSGEFTLPAAVTGETGEYTVSSIGDYAFRGSKITSISFEALDNIKNIGLHAFAWCKELEAIETATTVSDAIELFKGIGVDARESAFYQTLLDGAPEQEIPEDEFYGDEEVVGGLSASNGVFAVTAEHNPLLTGQTHTVTVNASNDGSDSVLRLYFKCSDGCQYDSNLGEVGEVQVTLVDIEGTDYHYYQIGPVNVGSTQTFNLHFTYPNGKPDGSTLYMWAIGGTSASFADNAGQLILPTDSFAEADGITADGKYLKTVWNTKEYHYPVLKEKNKVPELIASHDEKHSKTVSNLSYNIHFDKDPETGEDTEAGEDIKLGHNNNYGADYVKYIEFEDTLTLPEYVSWRDGIKEALESGNYRSATVNNKITDIYVTLPDRVYKLATITSNNPSPDLNGSGSFKIDGEGKVVITWHIYNPKEDNIAEMPEISVDLLFGPEVLVFDEEGYKQNNEGSETLDSVLLNTFSNNVKAYEHYYYADTFYTEFTKDEEINIAPKESDFTLTKERLNSYDLNINDETFYYFGEDAFYKITASNSEALDNANVKQIKDELTKYHYIKPSNIEAMFAEADAEGRELEITIKNAVISKNSHKETVTLIDGKTQAELDSQYVGTSDKSNEETYTKYYSEDSDVLTDSAEIVITGGQGVYNVLYDGKTYTAGAGQEYADIETVLDEIRFIITEKCTYTVNWKIDGLPADTKEVFNIYSTIKDSFMLLVDDRNQFYGSSENIEGGGGKTALDISVNGETSNKAFALREDGTEIKSASVPSVTIKPEIQVQKSSTVTNKEGAYRLTDYEFNDDTFWENIITISHYSKTSYDVLPVVDYLSGITAVLAPVDDNKNAAWATSDLKIYTDDDNIKYYILMPTTEVGVPKEFKGVRFGDYYADSVVTTRLPDRQIETITKWYVKDYLGTDSSTSINYKTYSSLETLEYYTDTDAEWEAARRLMSDNRVWLGDRLSHRLTDYKTRYLYSIKFDKKIVTQKGSKPALDILNNEDFSVITKTDNEVTYRLEFRNEENIPKELMGREFQDILPYTEECFDWSKDNISVSYSSYGDNVEFYYGDTVLAKNEISAGNEYKISPKSDVTGQDDKLQYLRWDESGFKVILPAVLDESVPYYAAYIYVTLKFPGQDSDDAVWDNYLAKHIANGSETLSNVLEAFGSSKKVTHQLSDTGMAFIQKGVYETSTYTLSSQDLYSDRSNKPQLKYYYRGKDRFTYHNSVDSNETVLSKGAVAYYIVIKNSSKAPLYLSTIYDCLPKGFEFYSLRNNGDPTSWSGVGCTVKGALKDGINTPCNLLDNSKKQHLVDAEGDLADYSPLIKVSSTEEKNGHTVIGFNIELPEGKDKVKGMGYDSQMKQTYLDPGFYIQFGYECLIGAENTTEDIASNSVAMMITDNGQEFALDTDTKVTVSDYNGLEPNNDGARYMWTNDEASKHGFEGGKSSTKWLASDVTVYRGNDIVPGIEKTVTKTIDDPEKAGSKKIVAAETDEDRSIHMADKASWRVTEYNDGNDVLDGYTFTDTLEIPQYFSGNINYASYIRSSASYPADGLDKALVWAEGSKLFTFEWNKSENELSSVSITTNVGGSAPADKYKITFTEEDLANDTPKEAYFKLQYGSNKPAYLEKSYYNSAMISFKKNDADITMTIKFPKQQGWGIVPDGYAVFDLQSNNQTGIYEPDPDIYNTAIFSPRAEYDENQVINGENIQQDGVNVGVTASDYVISDVSYPTKSENKIHESDLPQNEGIGSKLSNNKIVVDDKNDLVEYTLWVKNSESIAMDWLVLIDNLPQPGDTNAIAQNRQRGSEFMVSLYTDPGFKVTIKDPDGTEQSINYTIQYSDKTEFDSNDWRADSVTTAWNTYVEGADLSSARSVRLVIDSTIPEKSEIEFKYTAKIDETGAADKPELLAEPGEIAWNTFGYQYQVTPELGADSKTQILFATPLKVGLMIPTEPSVKKQLVDSELEPIDAEETTTFEFIIYKGDSISFVTGYGIDAVQAELFSHGVTEYALVTLGVAAGATESEEIPLSGNSIKKYKYNEELAKFEESIDDPWTWDYSYDPEDGTKIVTTDYNIVELEAESGKTYKFYSSSVGSNTTRERSRHFTYNPENNITLKFSNTKQSWNINVIKTDESGTSMLEGAVFGLYSPVELTDEKKLKINEAIIAAGFVPDEVATLESYDDGPDAEPKTYYLCAIATTNDIGRATFTNIIYDTYLLKELRAPDGYYVLNKTPETGKYYTLLEDYFRVRYPEIKETDTELDQDQLTKTVTLEIANKKGSQLPSTGGHGLKQIAIAIGLAVMASSGVLLLALRLSSRRRKHS